MATSSFDAQTAAPQILHGGDNDGIARMIAPIMALALRRCCPTETASHDVGVEDKDDAGDVCHRCTTNVRVMAQPHSGRAHVVLLKSDVTCIQITIYDLPITNHGVAARFGCCGSRSTVAYFQCLFTAGCCQAKYHPRL